MFNPTGYVWTEVFNISIEQELIRLCNDQFQPILDS